MANDCDVTMAFFFNTEEAAGAFYNENDVLLEEAETLGDAFVLSDTEIADAEIEQDGSCVTIHGTVKWMLDEDNAKDIVSDISLCHKDCQQLVLYYSEEGTKEFGEYRWQRGTGISHMVLVDKETGEAVPEHDQSSGQLTLRYIPEWAWPKWNDPTKEDRTMAILVDGRRMDSFSMALQETLEDFGKEEVLDNCI